MCRCRRKSSNVCCSVFSHAYYTYQHLGKAVGKSKIFQRSSLTHQTVHVRNSSPGRAFHFLRDETVPTSRDHCGDIALFPSMFRLERIIEKNLPNITPLSSSMTRAHGTNRHSKSGQVDFGSKTHLISRYVTPWQTAQNNERWSIKRATLNVHSINGA